MEPIANSVTDNQPEAQGLIFGKTPRGWKDYWKAELEAEHKRHEHWRRFADGVVRRYLAKRRSHGPTGPGGRKDFQVNMFHTNTETLMAFLSGKLPQADVSRRFADSNDDQARVAANILQRMLNTSIETDGGDFNSVLRSGLEDFLVPGMGIARVRYEVETEEQKHDAIVSEDTGEVFAEEYTETRIVYEDAPVDYIHWRDFHWGYGRIWKDVPWVGYDEYMTREQVQDRFGADAVRVMCFDKHRPQTKEESEENPVERDNRETAKVTEIWSKTHNRVYWYNEEVDEILDVQEDPLGLDGFFPSPTPLAANTSTTLFRPTPFFHFAEDLYNEVDELSTRINIITEAVKVVGVYDRGNEGIKGMLQEGLENDLIPVDNWAMFAEKGGVKGVIDFWPVETIVEVLDKLRQMRVEALDLLYQVTGMSDIMRGASGDQYEAASKSQLKARFGSIKVQKLQDDFARFASDVLRLKAEVISKHFEPQTIVQQSNIGRSYDVQQMIPAIQLIKRPYQAEWRIEIKPESMAMVDWAQLKADRTEYLNSVAVFLQSASGIIQLEPTAVPFLLELMKWGLAGYKGGQEIESVVDQAIRRVIEQQQARQGQDKPSEEMQKAQADLMKTRAKLEADLKKQADKAIKELQKIVAQTRADLIKTEADVEATAIKETIQADQNIREQRARTNA